MIPDNSISKNHTHASTSTASESQQVNTLVSTGEASSSANAKAIENSLSSLFSKHMTGENQLEIKQLIQNRAARLNEMGETPQSIDAVIAKGQRLDSLAEMATGALGGIPFAGATKLLEQVPAISSTLSKSPAYAGFIGGLVSGAMDTVGTEAMKKAKDDRLWMAAKKEELEPVMQQALKTVEPTAKKQIANEAMALQTYSLRNLVRTGATAITKDKMSPEKMAAVDTWITAAGGLASGAGTNAILLHQGKSAGTVGPEFLFGRQNWESTFTALKEMNSLTGPVKNASKRLAHVPIDMVKDLKNLTLNSLGMHSVVRNAGTLGGGFSATEAMKDKVSNPIAKQAVNTAAGAGVFAAWAGTDAVTTKVKDSVAGAASQVAEKLRHSSTQNAQPSPGQPLDQVVIDTPADDASTISAQSSRMSSTFNASDRFATAPSSPRADHFSDALESLVHHSQARGGDESDGFETAPSTPRVDDLSADDAPPTRQAAIDISSEDGGRLSFRSEVSEASENFQTAPPSPSR